MTLKRIFMTAVAVAGVALFAYSLSTLGTARIVEAMSRVGWGFGAIVLLAGAREVVRTLAWMRTVEGPVRLRFGDAFRARLAGEALSTLLPMGILVGEPAKAAHVQGQIPLARAFSALAVEFAFYCSSLAVLFGASVVALAAVGQMPFRAAALIVALAAPIALFVRRVGRRLSSARAVGTAGVDVIAVVDAIPAGLRRLANVVLGFGERHPERFWPIVLFEIAFQVLAVAEVYVTLMLISPTRPTVASAVVLETVSRAITMVFKILPMRLGVDEAGASLFASRLDLGSATGITLALVRKLRMLVLSAIGLLCLVRQWPRRAASSPGAYGTDKIAPAALPRYVITILLLSAMSGSGLLAAQAQAPSVAGSVSGLVSIGGPDGQPMVLPGVVVTLTCADGAPRTEVSNDQGEVQFAGVPTGSCSIAAELQGFRSATKAIEVRQSETANVALQLGLDTLREEVTVSASSIVDGNPIASHVERVTGALMQTAPIANERFQDALPLIPGVVRGPDGLLNIGGARSNQSALVFNNADGTDPVTGEDAIELPLDAVRSVQVRGTAYAPEFGLSVGAVTTVETEQAGEAWHFQVNDLEPRPRRRGGKWVGIESFTPRFTVGGPVIKGKVSVLESVQYEFTRTRVSSLPPFQSDTQLESFESFSRVDWTPNGTNHFIGSAMVSPRKTTYAGLNTFNPQDVTPDIKNYNVLGSAADQIIVGDRGFVETRVAVKQFDSTIYPSQGQGPMVLAPDVNSGSYFNNQDRTSRRFEWFNTYSFTPLGPEHLVKIGAGVTYETFDGTNVSRPVEIVRENGTLDQAIAFVGDGRLNRHKTSLQGYVQDAWTVHPRLSVQYGARFDHDSITGDINIAPRGSFTATLSQDGRTVMRAGVGMFYDPIPLNVASFDQMQERVVTTFEADGVTPVAPPVRMPNVVGAAIHTPRSVNWNLEVDRELIRNLFVRVGYQQRDNRFESVLDPVARPSGEQWLMLRTDGRSRYREGQITGRYQFHGSDQIVASFTRSSAAGNLNDFNSYFGNIENPVIRPDAQAPLAWDAPNRFLFWSTVSLPQGFTVFPLVDVRTGFPLSVIDEERNFVGPRNEAGRFPTFLSLDMQVSKRLRLFGHNATIGLKVFNITNHFNPRDYQGNLASADFGGFANGVGRTFRGKWIFEF